MFFSFFQELGLLEADINLEVGSGSHALQTAEIMKRFEPVLMEQQPDVLLVVGDVNFTIACTLVASKINYPEGNNIRRPLIVHVEAGLRSFDREVPEEVNRVLTDAISDVLFVTEESGRTNLLAEGVAEDKIHFVGNVMIDTLQRHIAKACRSMIKQDLGITKLYALLTLHRPSNVDKKETLQSLIESIQHVAKKSHVVLPVHPRTRQGLKTYNLLQSLENDKTLHCQSR
jgi:UDP-N-acetylglucosamine 2-epimerase (non-hydrolysing)